jgi:mono/diheme cytochrome c family protein
MNEDTRARERGAGEREGALGGTGTSLDAPRTGERGNGAGKAATHRTDGKRMEGSVRARWRPWAAVAALAILASCGSARRSEPIAGPLTLDDPVLIRGEQAFAVHCNACHPRGEAGMGPALNNRPVPTWAIRLQVRAGLGVMPAFSRDEIPPDELDALLRYMMALRRHGR